MLGNSGETATVDLTAWGSHWLAGECWWQNGLSKLQQGVLNREPAMAMDGAASVNTYFNWVKRVAPENGYFASNRCVEVTEFELYSLRVE